MNKSSQIRRCNPKSDDVWKHYKLHYWWIFWNSRSLNTNKIIYINHLIKEYNPDIIVICETWIDKDPPLLDTDYEMFKTWNVKHQRVSIITIRNMVKMSYNNDEPFLMAVEFIQKGTFIIGVYMHES